MTDSLRPRPTPLAEHWTLDPAVCFLNHGSFGATPRRVLDAQARWRAQMERNPVDFMQRALQPALDHARDRVAAFVGARPRDVAFSNNATTAVNGLLASFPLVAGDEVLVTDHAYNACRYAADVLTARVGARVVTTSLPFPCAGPDALAEAVLAALTPRTRLVLLDHVTSPTALVLPVERLVPALRERGVEAIVDGAHAPGMLPLAVEALGAWAYVGNLHKWVCAPKGAAFLAVRDDARAVARPVLFGHFAHAPATERFRVEHDWLGTDDPTAWLSVPDAIDTLAAMHAEGWAGLYRDSHAKAVAAQGLLCAALGVEAPCPGECLGSMATVPLPAGLHADGLQERLWRQHQIEVPIIPWGRDARGQQRWWVRVAMAPYTSLEQVAFLAERLR